MLHSIGSSGPLPWIGSGGLARGGDAKQVHELRILLHLRATSPQPRRSLLSECMNPCGSVGTKSEQLKLAHTCMHTKFHPF